MTLKSFLLLPEIWNAFPAIMLLLCGAEAEDACLLTADKLYGDTGKPNITEILFVVLLPCKHRNPLLRWSHIGPAIIQGVIEVQDILPSHMEIHVQYNDSRCSNSYAPWAALQAQRYHPAVHAFFGPVCDYAVSAVATMLKFLKVPLLTAGAHAAAFSEPKTNRTSDYYLLTKTGLSFLSVANLLMSLGGHYKWTKYKLLYETQASQYVEMEKFCPLLLDAFAKLLNAKGHSYSGYSLDAFKSAKEENLKREIGNQYGVIVICASPNTVRDILLTATDLKMMEKGEYTFFNIELFKNDPQPWFVEEEDESANKKAKKAYEALITIGAHIAQNENFLNFSRDIERISKDVFKSDGNKETPNARRHSQRRETHPHEKVSLFSTAFYEAVIVYANTLKKALDENEFLNIDEAGEEISKRMQGETFSSRIGTIKIDENGDRYADYAVMDMDPVSGVFMPALIYTGATSSFETVKDIHWPGGNTKAPPDTPKCGYDGANCAEHGSIPVYVIVLIALTCIAIFLVIIGILVYRYYKREAALTAMTWKLSRFELVPAATKPLAESRFSMIKPVVSMSSTSSQGTIMLGAQSGVKTAFYKGTLVAVKELKPNRIEITRHIMKDMNTMKDLQCDYLVRFIGACTELPDPCLVTEYCTRGSLKGILENEEMKLDWLFRFSLMCDIVKGMVYLHNSDISTHGSLSSENCVVDTRFVLKITNFGVVYLREVNSDQRSQKYWQCRLWVPPELLRKPVLPPEGTQKGDIYAYGIILHEIVYRQGPFNILISGSAPRTIVNRVVQRRSVPFRPRLEETDCRADVLDVMTRCWAEDPTDRPDFKSIQNSFRKYLKETAAGNLLDNLLKRMAQYADNLEVLVEERTSDYLEEKKKCERVLYELLPKSVARQLIMGQAVEAEAFDCVTIYFSDIVGFTALSAKSTPMQVVVLLNALYTTFDSVIQNFDVYKVETIGDAYMVVSGLPVRNGNLHAREIARMSLALLQEVKTFIIPHLPEEKMKLRIGIHSGPCVAGVVGLKMPRYCLFGDTVNTASRMESNGEPLRIHMSTTTRDILLLFGIFRIELRGEIEAKGKGVMVTYWLNGEKGSTTIRDGGSMEDHGRSMEDHGRSMEDHGRSMEDHGSSMEDYGRAKEDHGGSMENDIGSKEDHGGSMENDIGSKEDHGGSMENDIGSMEDDKGSMEEDGGSVEEDGGSLEGHGGSLERHGGFMEVNVGFTEDHGESWRIY